MSRNPTVSQLKSKNPRVLSDKPREGTKLRRMYDLLLTGQSIKVMEIYPKRGSWKSDRDKLRDFYGLEFAISKPHQGIRCIGVWDGPYLVPIEEASID